METERWTAYRVDSTDAGRTVQEILTGALGVSGRRIQKLTRSRGIRLNGKPTFLARRVRQGDVVAFRSSDSGAAALAGEAIPLEILYEDQDLLVVNKPPRMLVHPTSGQRGTLVHGVAHYLRQRGDPARPHAVHRLDRDTTGAVLIAKSAVAHHRLAEELRRGGIEREYLALVEGDLRTDHGRIDAPIGAHPTRRDLRAAGVAGGDPAVTLYDVEERYPDATLVRIRLETGRTHQIRVHFAFLAHPLIGDRAYGGRAAGLGRQALHAARLTFPSAGPERIAVHAALPADFRAELERVRAGAHGLQQLSPGTIYRSAEERMKSPESDPAADAVERKETDTRKGESKSAGREERSPRAVPAEEGDHSLKPHGDPLAEDPESPTKPRERTPGSR